MVASADACDTGIWDGIVDTKAPRALISLAAGPAHDRSYLKQILDSSLASSTLMPKPSIAALLVFG